MTSRTGVNHEPHSGRTGRRLRAAAMRLGMLALFVVSVPLVGLAMSYPLWYLSTHHRGLYSLVMVVGILMGIYAYVRWKISRRAK